MLLNAERNDATENKYRPKPYHTLGLPHVKRSMTTCSLPNKNFHVSALDQACVVVQAHDGAWWVREKSWRQTWVGEKLKDRVIVCAYVAAVHGTPASDVTPVQQVCGSQTFERHQDCSGDV